MPIITRFGGSGGGTPIVCPYPHVWECTVVQSGTVGVVSGVVNLEHYDILHYTMPLGFSTYTLMIGGTTYTTSFLNDGEMYIQWDGNDFVVVSANAGCSYPHVWTSPTYTITGSVLEITGGVDNLATNDIIVLTLSSGESASVIEYNSTNYVIDQTIDDSQTNYVQFNGSSFDLINYSFINVLPVLQRSTKYISSGSNSYTFNNFDVNKILIEVGGASNINLTAISAVQSGSDVIINTTASASGLYLLVTEYDEVSSNNLSLSLENAMMINSLDVRWNNNQRWIDVRRAVSNISNVFNVDPATNNGVLQLNISDLSASNKYMFKSSVIFN